MVEGRNWHSAQGVRRTAGAEGGKKQKVRRREGEKVRKKQKAAFDKLPSTCSGPELVERQASQRGEGKCGVRRGKLGG